MDDVITDKNFFMDFFPRFALGHIPEMLLIKVNGKCDEPLKFDFLIKCSILSSI